MLQKMQQLPGARKKKKSTSRPERKPYEMNNCKCRDFIPKYTQEYNNENIIESAMRSFGC